MNLLGHVASILIDDEISVELAGNNTNINFHLQASVKGKGLDELVKAAMIMKSNEM
jgi:hypothetical protein